MIGLSAGKTLVDKRIGFGQYSWKPLFIAGCLVGVAAAFRVVTISNPVAYYREMGFTSLDSIVYSTALIGSVGGLGNRSGNPIR